MGPSEVPGQHLPGLGEWDGPIFGELGVLAADLDGGRVRCHACGGWFKAVSHHARKRHNLTPAEYRALFGLNASATLDAPALRDRKRRHTAHLERYRPQNQRAVREMTTERRREIASRPRRLQTRIDPHNREVWARMQAAGVARSQELWRDPAYAGARARRMSEARGARVAVACAVCGAPLDLSRSEVRQSRRHTCAGACRMALRRRLLAEQGYLGGAELRARAGETRRRTLAARPGYAQEVGAKVSRARRRRDATVVERLRALPAAAWSGLPEPDRSMVRRYHGLDGEQPATARELAAAYRVTGWVVARMLTQAVARLLDPDAAPPVATSQEERARRRAAMAGRLRDLPEGALAGLPELDRAIITGFYGLGGGPPGRQRELARRFGVSRDRVRAALTRAAALVEREQHAGVPDGAGAGRRSPSDQLPGLGEWDGPIHGELGVLAVDGERERVQCHVCGRWFRSLSGTHLLRYHRLHPREYRAIFGLRARTSLIAPRLRALFRLTSEPQLRPQWARAVELGRSIPPEHRGYMRGRTWRLEALRDPHNVEVHRRTIVDAQEGAARARAAGKRWGRDPREFLPQAQARLRELRRDPVWLAAQGRKVSAAKGGRTPVPCVACGRPFVSPTHRRTCSPPCERARRGHPWTPMTPELRAKISQTKRRQGRVDEERLRALPPAAFAALGEPARTVTRLYFGLDGGRPHTGTEVAALLGLTRGVVEGAVARSVARLIGGGAGKPPPPSNRRSRTAAATPLRASTAGRPSPAATEQDGGARGAGSTVVEGEPSPGCGGRAGALPEDNAPPPSADSPSGAPDSRGWSAVRAGGDPRLASAAAAPASARDARTGPPRALMYLRVSTGEQERTGVSLGVQRAKCREWIDTHGWELGSEYLDVMRGDRKDRPQYQAMLGEVRRLRAAGREAVVVVERLDRFGRQMVEGIRCRDELRALGVPLHSVRDGGPVSDLIANILGAVAQDEVQRRWERMSAAVRQVVASGWYAPGLCPWGYRLRAATAQERAQGAPRAVLDLDEHAAPCVREAFERAARGQPTRELARWASSLPAGAKAGRMLGAGTLKTVLRNPCYVARPHGGVRDVLERPRGRWPAIVDETTWARVQERFASPATRHASGRYLLSGFLWCARCGDRASKGSILGRDAIREPVYRCNRRTCGAHVGRLADLDDAVLRRVRRLVDRVLLAEASAGRALETAWAAARPRSPRTEGRVRRAEADAEKARGRLVRAAELLADGRLDPGGYELVRDVAEADLAAAMDTLAAVARDRPRRPLPPLAAVRGWARHWRDALAGVDVPAQREVLLALVDRVETTRLRVGSPGTELEFAL